MKTIFYRLVFLFVAGLVFSGPVQAQLILNQPNTTGVFTNPQFITLAPGFSTGGNFSAKIQAAPRPPIPQNPSQNQNYVIQNRIRVADITEASQIGGLSADGLQQTITYFDGLGRPMQTVQTQASPDYKDLVTPMSYEPFGRMEKKYLPYASAGTGDGSYRPNALTEVNNFYNPPGGSGPQLPGGIPRIETPFSRTVYEASPLNRVIEQGFPGNTWQPAPVRTGTAGRTVVMDYQANTDQNGTRKVKLYKARATAANSYQRDLIDVGWYPANQLSVNIVKDENWMPGNGQNGTTEEFVDKQGRTVLKRSFNGTETLSTYYVYDDLGNLSFVLPPLADPDNGNIDQARLAGYCYQYYYDRRNRLIEKKVPGKGWEYLVYNELDQVVMDQDGVQRSSSPQQWTVSKYDALGRSIITGIYAHPGSLPGTNIRPAMQANVDSQSSQWETRTATGNGYTNVSWPGTWGTTLTINYYDNYNIPGLPANYLFPTGSTMTKTLPTASRSKILNGSAGTSDMLWTVNYYDDRGRAVKVFRQHYKGGVLDNNNYDEYTNSYDFTGQLTSSDRRHMVNGNQALQMGDEYGYDHTGRSTGHQQSINSTGSTQLSKNSYNAVGQLMETGLHGTDGNSFAQKVAYRYNERGWLVSSSAPLFAMELQYNNGTVPQYNGNISGQLWGQPANLNKNYTYGYDRLNRLTNGTSNENFNETLGYDRGGNILSLQRTRSGNELVDQLGYGYNNSNRLNTVTDAVPGTILPYQLPGTTSYGYDENGNISYRFNAVNPVRNVSFTYNVLNLPYQVSGSPSATYIYNADGEKLRAVTGSSATDYIDGINYINGNLAFVQTANGRAVKTTVGFSYEYTLKDHLGNARVSFDIVAGAARKIQEDDYYPFGLEIKRYASGLFNKYLYNSKELQDELTMYDYGARFYDPIIGRWNVVDPLSETMRRHSPYNYGFNNPIRFVDPDGMAPYDWYQSADNKNVKWFEGSG